MPLFDEPSTLKQLQARKSFVERAIGAVETHRARGDAGAAAQLRARDSRKVCAPETRDALLALYKVEIHAALAENEKLLDHTGHYWLGVCERAGVARLLRVPLKALGADHTLRLGDALYEVASYGPLPLAYNEEVRLRALERLHQALRVAAAWIGSIAHPAGTIKPRLWAEACDGGERLADLALFALEGQDYAIGVGLRRARRLMALGCEPAPAEPSARARLTELMRELATPGRNNHGAIRDAFVNESKGAIAHLVLPRDYEELRFSTRAYDTPENSPVSVMGKFRRDFSMRALNFINNTTIADIVVAAAGVAPWQRSVTMSLQIELIECLCAQLARTSESFRGALRGWSVLSLAGDAGVFRRSVVPASVWAGESVVVIWAGCRVVTARGRHLIAGDDMLDAFLAWLRLQPSCALAQAVGKNLGVSPNTPLLAWVADRLPADARAAGLESLRLAADEIGRVWRDDLAATVAEVGGQLPALVAEALG